MPRFRFVPTIVALLLPIAAPICFAACATATPNAPAAPKQQKPAPAPYVEKIPGTTVQFEMIGLPAGEITFPDPAKPNSTKTEKIDSIWMGKTEVSWDAFDLYVYGLDQAEPNKREKIDGVTYPTRPYISMDRSYGHAGYPAISMSYHNAEQFCAWLSSKTGKLYRLPTEAEWRYACAAGASEFPNDAELLNRAWVKENSERTTHPLGAKHQNAFGLFDMLGNASEWALGADGKPVTVGGNFRDALEKIKTNYRVSPSPAWNASDPQMPKSIWWLADGGFVGFRVVCEPGKK